MKASYDSPIIIGGLPGSGTRAFVQTLYLLGVFFGRANDLNLGNYEPLSVYHKVAKWTFSYLDIVDGIKDKYLKEYSKLTNENYLEIKDDQYSFEEEYRKAIGDFFRTKPDTYAFWGYKHPEMMYLLPFLAKEHPNMRYIHVIRDGRDMAYHPHMGWFTLLFSRYYMRKIRKIQWGGTRITPQEFIDYWNWVNLETAKTMKELLPTKSIVVKFEDLCYNPVRTLHRICFYFDIPFTERGLDDAAKLIKFPETIGRHKGKNGVGKVEEIGKEALTKYSYLED